MYLGIDIGSSSSKAALINHRKELVATSVVNMGTGTKGPEMVLENVLKIANISKEDIKYTIATGYGRITFQDANLQITEISCHAKGASFLMEDVATVIDIGGQDAKVIKIGEDGKVKNFVMNEKCAAGTGRFLEVMARVLNCKIEELSDLAEKSTNDIPISSVCTVFAESEVISQLASGAATEDVAKGAHVAIVKRIRGMCNRIGYEPLIAMTGGVALNSNIVKLMGEELGHLVVAAPYPQAVGSIGAAVFAYEKSNREDE
ncbi:acyl-CoA dehydratase activase [Sinanaerobacter chloroacetimidivorans]|uniref:2-hydroxyglutaryl-CoA dehydratase n=1 Tax=Sinanaerobacter chloroacetimidivorans TaxID=2818044 RepID=A0A8J8B141_9FIRM|nr:acyl-CoA dehydratase activase [Sinanaerobacter chloroacetimidivorans]MBR0597849.1 2-hydroxyglutaryl-CoA dehydratase [Sinanaerobacter chloroacetimidivorans]